MGIFSIKVHDKINLVVIITPYIVPKTKDLTYIRNKLAHLKLLEDKYTKDTILRLEKAKLQSKEEDLKREQEKIELDESRLELRGEMLEFSEDKKDYYDEKKKRKEKKLTENQRLHQERIRKMFGI